MADNRKGGYQIIDLSSVTVGTQATIAGVYAKAGGNNKKPIMIITPDGQRVFAEVKAGTNKYVTAYLGADGSTYTVEISNANKVDITKDDLEERVGANKTGTQVTLDTYNASDNMYTLPSDGYVIGVTSETLNEFVNINIYGSQTSASGFTVRVQNTEGGGNTVESVPVFCRKGMKCYVANRGTGCHAYFLPLV